MVLTALLVLSLPTSFAFIARKRSSQTDTEHGSSKEYREDDIETETAADYDDEESVVVVVVETEVLKHDDDGK
jgi:hypothetical protein